MKIGAMDGALAQDWGNLFRVAAQIGFEGVELGVGENYSETQLWRAAGRKVLMEYSRASNVPIASLCLHAYWRYSFASNDEFVRRRASDIAEQAAAIASELGARNLLIPVTSAEGVTTKAARQGWIEGMRSCASVAEKQKVVYALENVGQPFAETGKQMASIVDAIDSPAVRVYYDPGNAIHLDPVSDINTLGERISQVHMKDPGGMHLGQGKMDIPSVMKALKQNRFNGWIMLETPATEDPIQAGKANLAYLRGLL